LIEHEKGRFSPAFLFPKIAMLERFSVSRNRFPALSFALRIPDGKPLRTFPGIAQEHPPQPIV
jgi:hypothetical protein